MKNEAIKIAAIATATTISVCGVPAEAYESWSGVKSIKAIAVNGPAPGRNDVVVTCKNGDRFGVTVGNQAQRDEATKAMVGQCAQRGGIKGEWPPKPSPTNPN